MSLSRGNPSYSETSDDDCAVAISGNVTVADGGSIHGRLLFTGDKNTRCSIGPSPEPLGRALVVRKADGASVILMASRYDLIDGVVFENVLEEGIMVSPEQRKKWKNVSYGERNLAEPEALYYDSKPAAD